MSFAEVDKVDNSPNQSQTGRTSCSGAHIAACLGHHPGFAQVVPVSICASQQPVRSCPYRVRIHNATNGLIQFFPILFSSFIIHLF